MQFVQQHHIAETEMALYVFDTLQLELGENGALGLAVRSRVVEVETFGHGHVKVKTPHAQAQVSKRPAAIHSCVHLQVYT